MIKILQNASLFFLLILLGSGIVNAQGRSGRGLTLRGKVVSQGSGQPIEYATILVASKNTEKAITGTTSTADGTFEVSTDSTNIFVEVRFLGFESQRIAEFKVENRVANLGTIELVEKGSTLEEVEIRAEQSQTVFQLDKRVFNVGQDLSSTGASAMDVLNNVPSVNVNIEGEISLRGNNGVQILINGKPSVMANEENNALGTLTADMIDKIEVITNPGAKYEAEGTAGIINIVLKKEEKKGLNGSFSLNTGWPHNHSLGLSLNRRTEKFNLFSQLGAGYRSLPQIERTRNVDLTDSSSIISDGKEFRNETFVNVILGTDYYINKYNVITLSGYFAYEWESQPSLRNFYGQDANGAVTSAWEREESTTAGNPKYQYELQYKKDFRDKKDHDLLISATGNLFWKQQASTFRNSFTIGAEETTLQETQTDWGRRDHTFKLDYTNPIAENWTIEAGSQYSMNAVGNDYRVSDLVNGNWEDNLSLTNDFEYNQNVLAVYGTGAWEGEKWGLKLGMRAENTDLRTLLVTTNEANNRNFTNFFPSGHTSYKFSPTFSMQAGYSRRIRRPRLWDLNPFFNIRNNFSIRTGNPDLLPEYSNSYEINSIWILDKASLNFGVFHLQTTDVIERVTTFEEGVTYTMPMNIGVNNSTGIEINGKYHPSKNITLMGDLNMNYFVREGTFDSTSFDFSGQQMNGKLTSKFKLPWDIDAEATGHYRSGFQTIQGRRSANLFLDLGLRKKLMKGRAIINFSVRDVFASRFRETFTEQPTFYSYSYSRRGRFITLGFSFGFGKGEAMEFSGGKRHW